MKKIKIYHTQIIEKMTVVFVKKMSMINFDFFNTQLFVNFYRFMCKKVEYEKNQNFIILKFSKK
jgi:hypothetical protein